MNGYCCNKFQFLATGQSTMGLNIRIIKVGQNFVEANHNITSPYLFFISEAYSEFINAKQKILITFCPFCGVDLKKKYNTDNFINEYIHDFL